MFLNKQIEVSEIYNFPLETRYPHQHFFLHFLDYIIDCENDEHLK